MALASSAGCALASPQRSVRSPLIPDVEIWRCAALTIKATATPRTLTPSQGGRTAGGRKPRGAAWLHISKRLRRRRSRTAREPSIDTGSTRTF